MRGTISVAEFKRRLSDCLGRTQHKRERFVITRHGRPVAQLLPMGPAARPARAKGWLADSDPFFRIVDSIVADRERHLPRVFSAK